MNETFNLHLKLFHRFVMIVIVVVIDKEHYLSVLSHFVAFL